MTENKLFKIVNDCGDYHLMNGDEILGYDLCSPAMREENWNNVVNKLNEQEETIKGYKEILDLDKEDNLEVEHINDIYKQYGFDGVIDYATGKLSEYGAVREVDKGLWVMVTGGWSDHENWIHCLNDLLCMFGYKHYCGYVRGGAFYYSEDTDRSVEITF